ncbi:hypothetical protein EDD36DRAFT_159043 [Exophiala viscosa]|uniref:protein-tyrosine-phosphatase n=1 Tax=Exophiala viscosa TaxID=2486360 RepID=A0AAN6E3S2_9EURO|nr:hypothetical protein EDD36DRAFT_159043 [Exophiala viscosa]
MLVTKGTPVNARHRVATLGSRWFAGLVLTYFAPYFQSSRSVLTTRTAVSNIRRILSVLQPHEILKPTTLAYDDNDVECSGGPAQIQFKSILIDDDPTIDILQHLGTACDWIQDGLQPMSKDGAEPPRGVLVHCRQGNSRSGAFVVAYIMWTSK